MRFKPQLFHFYGMERDWRILNQREGFSRKITCLYTFLYYVWRGCISHLFFADDVLFCSKARSNQARKIEEVVSTFCTSLDMKMKF